jgi:hypothetical protein
MKPTPANIEKRVTELENRPGAAPVELQVVYVGADGTQTTDWETTSRDVNGTEFILHLPKN